MASGNRRRSGNPAIRSGATSAEDVSALRDSVHQRSRPVLQRMSRLPTFVIPLCVLILMVIGLAAPPTIALPAFAVLLAFVTWLAYLSWPALDSRGRMIRVGLIFLVFLSAALQSGGWF